MKFYKALFIVATSTLTQILLPVVAFSRPVVKVSSSKNAEAIKKHAEVYLAHLGVQENIHLVITLSSNMSETLPGITIPLPSPQPGIEQKFMVLINANLDKAARKLVLAHEMIHVKQYAKKELVVDVEGVTWMGKKIHYSPAKNLRMPWEKEAYHIDHPLVRLVQDAQLKDKGTLAKGSPASRLKNVSGCGSEESNDVKTNSLIQTENMSIH
ncbi:hypothetical protein OB13_02325 [Pontibacter sp. HJ8]